MQGAAAFFVVWGSCPGLRFASRAADGPERASPRIGPHATWPGCGRAARGGARSGLYISPMSESFPLSSQVGPSGKLTGRSGTLRTCSAREPRSGPIRAAGR